MLKIISIIGARPQIIKAAALNRTIKNFFSSEIEEIIVHTGQHYDFNMSDIFINELSINPPKYNLNIGSGNQGHQTAAMISSLEEVLINEMPDWCIVYGDTNSTLAASIAAVKLNIKIAHIEAGLRSYNKTMPEEVNRIACDHFSSLLFVPTKNAISNLAKEGFNINNSKPYSINNPVIINCGDIMLDNILYFKELSKSNSNIIQKHKLNNSKYILCTIHRQNNTEDIDRLKSILEALIEISQKLNIQIIIPLHPRTKQAINASFSNAFHEKLFLSSLLKFIEPVSYLDMIALQTNSSLIITDSGGVQKESYFLKKPCVILRNETEWIEITEQKTAILVDADKTKIVNSTLSLIENPPTEFPTLFGTGNAAFTICKTLLDF